MLKIDVAQAEAFVCTLTGSPSTIMVFQCADDLPSKRKELERVFVGTVRELADVLGRMNTAGAAVWVQINAGRRGLRNVTELRAVFVDDDGKATLPPLLHVPPSIVVGSSAGARNRHYYWLLRRGESLERFTPTQKQLISSYQTDKSIHNLDRVMRLPGSYNMKRGAPQPVTLLHTDITRKWSLDEMMAAHPVSEAEQRAFLSEPQPDLHTDAALTMARRVGAWLTEQGIIVSTPSPVSFKMRCVFNPAHGDKLMIRIQPRGGLWAGCFHDSCGGNVNRWAQLKDKIGGWAGGQALNRGDDVELAGRLLQDLGADSEEPLVFDMGKLWRYAARGLWEPIERDIQAQRVASYAGQLVGDKRRLRVSAGTLKGTVACAQALAVQPGFFDAAAPGIAFSNGFLAAIPGGSAFVPHAPDHRQIVGLASAYDSTAHCLRWMQYLHECFEGDADRDQKILLLQEFLGACLVGIAAQFQKALLLVGEGANGKSVYTTVAYHLFPPGTRSAIKPQDLGSEFTRAHLAGIRCNIVSEMPETEILASDSWKAIVAGDPIGARHPYGDSFEYRPVAGHIMAANRLPGTGDHSHGFWRRFLIIMWNRNFEATGDKGLGAYLVANELPGIAAWAARGAARLLEAQAYTHVPSIAEALSGWRLEVDPVAAFLKEATISDAFGTKSSDVYAAYRAWLSTNGHRLMSHAGFARRLRAHGYLSEQRMDGSYYKLRVTAPPPSPFWT